MPVFHQRVPRTSGPLTDRSSTISGGGISQTVCAANEGRVYFFFQNISDTAMWLDFDGTAAVANQPSIRVDAGASLVFESAYVPNGAVQVFCSTISKAYVCKEA